MVFLAEFTSDELTYYECQLKEGVFTISKPLGCFKEWYILERNDQILFQKIKKCAEVFPCAIFFEEPSLAGVEGDWKEWTTLSTNQRKLSVALDYLIAQTNCVYSSTPFDACGKKFNEFTPERLAYYNERLDKGVFIIPTTLGNWQEWYILERNQHTLFEKIQKLAKLDPAKLEPSVLGFEDGWKEWTTLSTNQKRLSDALDLLPVFKKPSPCTG